MKHLLVIAGTDSSGGAGLTRDVSIATELGCRVRPVVTAVTAQTDGAVHEVHRTPLPVLVAQIETALASGPVDAVKIGMLGSLDCADAVAASLTGRKIPVVLDPVLKSSSGGVLMDAKGIGRLLAVASLITPNLDEAGRLAGTPLAAGEEDIATLGKMLLAQGARAVLIKGGHCGGPTSTDHLFEASRHVSFTSKRLPKGKRGTGCSLATAIACMLAQGCTLGDACRDAKDHVHTWLSDFR